MKIEGNQSSRDFTFSKNRNQPKASLRVSSSIDTTKISFDKYIKGDAINLLKYLEKM